MATVAALEATVAGLLAAAAALLAMMAGSAAAMPGAETGDIAPGGTATAAIRSCMAARMPTAIHIALSRMDDAVMRKDAEAVASVPFALTREV